MSERNNDEARDLERTGDVVGDESPSAFAEGRNGAPTSDDERLGVRGRDTGRGEGELLDAVDAERETRARRSEESDAGAG